MNSSFTNRWSFSYLKFTKYVTNIIAEPKYKYGQQEQVTIRNQNRSTAFLILFIRLFIGCELGIENSVTSVTVQHRESCGVILTDGIFNLHQTSIMDSFSCILFLRQLHLGLNMYSFLNFMQSRNNYIFQ